MLLDRPFSDENMDTNGFGQISWSFVNIVETHWIIGTDLVIMVAKKTGQ